MNKKTVALIVIPVITFREGYRLGHYFGREIGQWEGFTKASETYRRNMTAFLNGFNRRIK